MSTHNNPGVGDSGDAASLCLLFKKLSATFDIKSSDSITSLVSLLDTFAHDLARSEQLRRNAGSDPSLVSDLRKLWRDLARAQLSFWDGDDSEPEGDVRRAGNPNDLRSLCTSLSKFTRNMVAGVPENQSRVFENEPDIRLLLHYYTSWSAMEDSDSISAARVLTQALSNLVTANETLVAKLWETYMNLPEDQVVLIRLLASPDSSTLLTTLIFILNCIHASRKRAKLLTRTKIGARVCIALLDDMVKLYDAEDGTEGAQAFDIGYAIFTRLIEEGLVPDLYKRFHITHEIVTPHQTTLLKLVDSYLQSVQLDSSSPIRPEIVRIHVAFSPFLAKGFFTLSTYAQQAVRHSLGLTDASDAAHRRTKSAGSEGTGSPKSSRNSEESSSKESSKSSSPPLLKDLDVMLPKVCEALVLLSQCIITIGLDAEEQKFRQDQGGSSIIANMNMKEYFNDTRSGNHGMVESIIELLRLLDLFLPRINFGKPISTPQASPQFNQELDKDHAGFSYLKRDLVRLLGVLCHGETGVQDRIREANGIQVVMNMCVVDERNPYLREHAIFTLHALLKNNPENQKLVDSLKPSGEWDQNGVLQNKEGAVLK